MMRRARRCLRPSRSISCGKSLELPPLTPVQVAAYVNVFHPLVRTQPGGSREGHFYGDISAGAVEWIPHKEGDTLPRDFRDFSNHPQFTCRHSWNEGEVLIWVNRATNHPAADLDWEK